MGEKTENASTAEKRGKSRVGQLSSADEFSPRLISCVNNAFSVVRKKCTLLENIEDK